MFDWIKKYSKYATIFILGAALIAVYKTFQSFEYLLGGLGNLLDAIKPFIASFVIAYLLNIPVKKLNALIQRKVKNKRILKRSNSISIIIVYILFVIAILGAIGSLIPALYDNILEMYRNIPQLTASLGDFLREHEQLSRIGISPEKISNAITGIINIEKITDYTVRIKSITSGVFSAFISLIASVYMLIEKDAILTGIERLGRLYRNQNRYGSFMSHCSSVNAIFTQYIYARLMCCIIMAVASTLVLIIMGEPYALVLGIFIGFMDMIPYFGSLISWVVGFVFMLISGGLFHSIWCSAIILILQQIDGNVLAPKIMGNRLEISPLTVIIAVSVGGSLFGFLGMLISVPVVAILRASVTELIAAREQEINAERAEAEGMEEAAQSDTSCDFEDINGDGEAEDGETGL